MQSSKNFGLRPASKMPRPSSVAGSTGDLTSSRSTSPSVSRVLTENTDDFIVGNRVWVGGTKPGYIQYIGETKFAPGEWAGIVLDEPIGKNDGSVAGVKYFQCEPKKGVFSRLNKLTREPVLHLMNESMIGSNDSIRGAGVRSVSPKPMSTSRISLAASRSSTPSLDGVISIGDRVNVSSASGTKTGTLRYLGIAEFAAGEWAGIELDEAVGKNDGSVNGKRYFSCTMKYGLFAPIAKVSKSFRSAAAKTPPKAPISSAGIPKRSLTTPRRVGSQESVNTIGSTTSSASRSNYSKPRLGVTALTSAGNPSRIGPSLSATHTAMQGALKEKEQHIEQLIRERELEMADVAKSSARLEESEQLLADIQTEYQQSKEDAEANLNKARELIEVKEKENMQLLLQLDEEKKKNEDLQFRLEEEAILKSELDSGKEDESSRIQLLEERFQTEKLEYESQINFQSEEALAKYAEEVEILQDKLKHSDEINQKLDNEALSYKNQLEGVLEDLKMKSKMIDEMSDVNAGLLKESKLREGEAQEKANYVKSLLLEVEQLQQKLVNSNETIRNFESHESAKLSEVLNLETISKELQIKLNEIEQLKSTNIRLLNESKEREEEADKDKKVISNCTTELENLRQQLQNSDEIVRNLESKALTGEKHLEENLQELQKKSKEIEDLSGINTRMMKELKEYEECKSMLEGSRLNIQNLNQQLNTLQIERLDLEKKFQMSEERCLQQKMKFEGEIAELTSFSGDNSAHLVQLNELLRRRDGELEQSQRQCQQLDEDYKKKFEQKEIENRNVILENSSNAERKLKEECEKWTLNLESERTKMKVEFEKVKNEMEAQLVQSEEMLKSRNRELEHSQQQCQRLDADYKKLLEEKEVEIRNIILENNLNAERKLKEENEKWALNLENERTEVKINVEKMKNEMEKRLEEMKMLVMRLEEEKTKSDEAKRMTNDIYVSTERNLEDLKNELDTLRKVNDELRHSLGALKVSKTQLTDELEQLKETNATLNSDVTAGEENLVTLRKEMEHLKGQFDLHHFELQKQLDEAKLEEITIQNMKAHIEKQQRNLEDFFKDKQMSDVQITKLKEENVQIPELINKCKQLEGKLEAAEKIIAEMELKEKQVLSNFECEKDMTQKLAETSKLILDQRTTESLKLQSEISALKNEIINKEMLMNVMSKENDRLLQVEARLNANNDNNAPQTTINDEKEALELQVDFLNSVIVDMQKKVDDYQTKFQLLETHGSLDVVPDENLNEIKMAPRKFCDICDMFDVHETEDCPKQESSNSPPPTNFHGKRNQERPYCNICEVFGHWTHDCDDNETF